MTLSVGIRRIRKAIKEYKKKWGITTNTLILMNPVDHLELCQEYGIPITEVDGIKFHFDSNVQRCTVYLIEGKKERTNKKWTDVEDSFLIGFFNEIPMKKRSYSKYKKISLAMKDQGFDRSTAAVHSRATLLGLKDYEVKNEEEVIVKCAICEKEIKTPARYKAYKHHWCDEHAKHRKIKKTSGGNTHE